jgi:hypothetical protein
VLNANRAKAPLDGFLAPGGHVRRKDAGLVRRLRGGGSRLDLATLG